MRYYIDIFSSLRLIHIYIFFALLWVLESLPRPTNTLRFQTFIEFDNYSGPHFVPISDVRYNWIPINILHCSRTQIPIRLAYALTIHKSQGQSLDKVVIDLGKWEKSLGITIVAIFRVITFKDLRIKSFPPRA